MPLVYVKCSSESHNDSSITVTVSHFNYSKATKNHLLFYVMYCVTAMFLFWMNMRVAQIQERLTLLFYRSGLGHGTWAQKTDELHYRPPFQVIWCSMHSSSELNSGEDTSILSSEKDCISVKTFYTVISWQTTTAQAIRSPLNVSSAHDGRHDC